MIGSNQASPGKDVLNRGRSARDYQFGARIGAGSYSIVYSALDLHSKKTYAIKVLSKRHIVEEDKIKYVNIEKTTLHRLGQQHPGIVQLYYTFQDENSLFFVLDFAEYGELLSIIRKFGSLSEPVSKFYMCQIVDAVRFIHSKGVIHRDLKPENILVGYDFNLKITDFGAAKLMGTDVADSSEKIEYGDIYHPSKHEDPNSKGSFVGTAEYVSPELLKSNFCGFEGDIWALGCILYQFIHGVPPFKGSTEYLTFEKILSLDYTINKSCPQDIATLITNMLVIEPEHRITISQIMSSKWFQGVPWNDRNYIWHRKVPRFEPYSAGGMNHPSAPYVPSIKTGSKRDVNKSNSYQQLHSQILQSDLFIPSVSGKSTYQSHAKVKVPYQSVSHEDSPSFHGAPNGNPVSPNRKQSNSYGYAPSPSQVQYSVAPNQNYSNKMMAPNQMNGHYQYQQPLQDPHIKYDNKPGSQNYYNSPSMNYAPTPPSSSVSYSHSDEFKTHGERSGKPEYSSQNNTSPSAYAAAKAVSYPKNGTDDAKSSGQVVTNKPSTKREIKQKTQSTKKVSSKETRKEADITLDEITSLLEESEKILKMDTILKSHLSNQEVQRNKSQALDDSLIRDIIANNEDRLSSKAIPVITVITNKARIFLIDSSLNVMLIDLKANKGSDYSMYDYEFESLEVDDDDNLTGEDVYGYLILELKKEGGDLVFLKRIAKMDYLSLKSFVKVINKSGTPISIGKNHGWIDCLLMAKELMGKDKANTSKSNKNVSASSKNSSKSVSKKPSRPSLSKKPSSSQDLKKEKARSTSASRSASSSYVPQSKSSVGSFAYAAAAAAHK